MIPFPTDEILADGVAALRWAAARIRDRATREPESGPLWLEVRNLDGLADRIQAIDADGWKLGHAGFFVTGQDLGVLTEWLDDHAEEAQFQGGGVYAPQTAALRSLLAFLTWYIEHHVGLSTDRTTP